MIYFVTSNRGKMEEARAMLGMELSQMDIGYPEIQADTLEEVVIFGMKDLAGRLDGPVMIEDAGLFVDALNGFPGVFSAYAQKTIGNAGILRLMEGAKDRGASFKSVVGYAEPGEEVRLFRGELRGKIAFAPRGEGGFGYDPIFEVGGITVAEMGLQDKNRISHRGQSIGAMREHLSGRT
ncbi:MAG TPA: XTP/dITP diphosphatase [Methanotrichaceae archaeon]|nr:XTP/dITP diphosphatase [Methanotrichaceae archaeon]HQF16472.1 XTP/dITP diphosphatase [Methanotrichaceae archaeon]HQI91895.1 XTP/dITP diphosphatase [Methanotrichaceae archaeon]HQJ28452.1 XTP/dITP diphosphatase [Methanotrichaceae archaeon]